MILVYTCPSTGIKKARLPCWLSRGQQVLHQRWIWGIHCTQAMKHTSEGIHPGFETQGRRHQKSKRGVSVALQKDRCPLKKFLKRKRFFVYFQVVYLMFLTRTIYFSPVFQTVSYDQESHINTRNGTNSASTSRIYVTVCWSFWQLSRILRSYTCMRDISRF